MRIPSPGTIRSVVRFDPPSRDLVGARLARCASVEDLRALARRKLPRSIFDFVDGGSEDELTLAANSAAYSRIGFVPSVLRDVGEIDTSADVLGERASFPLVLAPTGFTRIVHPDGELAVARAAARAGIPYALSTMSTFSIEEVRAASTGRLWFQLYVMRDRGVAKDLLGRASAAGYEALLITLDTAAPGVRERDVRHGFSIAPAASLRTVLDVALHPRWSWAFATSPRFRFANFGSGGPSGSHGLDGATAIDQVMGIGSQLDPTLTWSGLEELRSMWPGRFVLKGIQSVGDASRARDAGVDAVVLSNHGGRQLDGAPASVDLLRDVRDQLGDDLELMCDGGVRRGSDIVKAVALGASACMAGRPYLYGLAAGGERGVDRMLERMQLAVRSNLGLLGVRSFDEVDRSLLELR